MRTERTSRLLRDTFALNWTLSTEYFLSVFLQVYSFIQCIHYNKPISTHIEVAHREFDPMSVFEITKWQWTIINLVTKHRKFSTSLSPVIHYTSYPSYQSNLMPTPLKNLFKISNNYTSRQSLSSRTRPKKDIYTNLNTNANGKSIIQHEINCGILSVFSGAPAGYRP